MTRVVVFLTLSCSFCFAFQNDGPLTPRVFSATRHELKPEIPAAADLHVDVPLVLIPVHVTTPLGASVTTLKKDSFHLFEDGVEQQITHFASEDAPISIGVLFDASGSMRNKIKKSTEAATAFFQTANNDDEFFLIEFNERAKLAIPFTKDAARICKYIAHTKTNGRTSLLDAIHLAMIQMKSAQHLRKALVIVSDGGDNRSRYTESEILSAVREADVQVYALGIFDPDYMPRQTIEERNGPQLLSELAEETGGRHYKVDDLKDLPDMCTKIGNELRNQYLLGYAPANAARNGIFRKVRVTISPPKEMPPLTAHHRQGYLPNSQ